MVKLSTLSGRTISTTFYQCKKCDRSTFSTMEQLKNHSRIHAQQCVVKFPLDAHDLHKEAILQRSDAGLFKCPRCLKFEHKFPAKMQAHSKTCKALKSLINCPGALNCRPEIPIQILSLANGARELYIESDLLYFINKDLHIAICQACRYVVDVNHLSQHSKRKHGRKADPARVSADVDALQLKLGIDFLAPYQVSTVALKEPIKGLAIVDGFGCGFCSFYCAASSTLKLHLSRMHHSSICTPNAYRACFVQQLTPKPEKNSWFGVSHRVQDIAQNPFINIIMAEDRRRQEEALAASYNDARHLPLFMKRLNWDQFIANFKSDVLTMALLVSKPGKEDARFFLAKLRRVCDSLMSDFQNNNGVAESLLRRRVKSAEDAMISKTPLSRLDQAGPEYAAGMVHLIILLFRSLNSDDMNDSGIVTHSTLIPLDDSLRQALHVLLTALEMEDESGHFTDEHVRLSKLHCMQVLEGLFFLRRPSHNIPETSSLVYRFVLFATLQSDHATTAGEITHRITKMMYWCRSLVLYKIVHTPVSDEIEAKHIEDHFLYFVRDGHRTPFASILEVKRLIFTITENVLPLPRVVWSGDGQIVDGVLLNIEDLSNMINKTIGELQKELESDLLMDMPKYKVNMDKILQSKSGGGIEDALGNRSVGYCFVHNKNNHCSDYTLDLVSHILTDPILCRKFTYGLNRLDGGDKICWNSETLRKWMRKAKKWLQKFLSLAHLVAGQPARGGEFLSPMIQNTPAQIRGVYYVDGLVMLLTIYSKADNLKGTERPVARFLCKQTSFLLINYLTYVRKMEEVASEVFYTKEQTSLYANLFAIKDGRAFEPRDLSEGISRLFLTHLGVPFSLNAWRHMAIAWKDRFLENPHGTCVRQTGPLDSQAGHSQRTASKIYGRSTNFDHPDIGRNEFQEYRLASVDWHKLFRLVTDDVPARSLIMNQNNTSKEVVSTIIPVHHHHHHHKVKVIRSSANSGVDFASPICSQLLLKGLLALGYNNFKSKHQARAIEQILLRQEDLLVVLPTGGGKTLLFLLPAWIERGKCTTVVICPFVALKKDMLDRLKVTGLTVQVYSEHIFINFVDILLVSVEHCLSEVFQNHLGSLHQKGQLGRIVIDECHLVLTATSWRPPLLDLRYVRKVPVPLLFLSATIPPQMEDALGSFFNSQLTTIRSTTVRPNIAYRVIRHQNSVNDTLVELLLSTPVPLKSIVFSRGRDHTHQMAHFLCSKGLKAVFYHGDLDETAKATSQNQWMTDEADIMVATGAFGTGIDYGCVRLVVHIGEPYSMMDLVQESGRGGRDGLPSEHIILLPMLWQPLKDGCLKVAEFIGGSKCRRWVLQEYIDGLGCDCFYLGSSKCDICRSMVDRSQSTQMTAQLEIAAYSIDDDDIDLFANMNEHDLAMLEQPPRKKICLGTAMLSESALQVQEQYTSRSLHLLNLAQFLEEIKDNCVFCVVEGRHDCLHPIFRCPYNRNLCFKCLDTQHQASKCENKLVWQGNNKCFGCGLPNVLGKQVLHPGPFGLNCRSIGYNKLVPACWYFWRNRGRFIRILETSGCPIHSQDRDFSEWLTNTNLDYQSNAIYLLHLFVAEFQ